MSQKNQPKPRRKRTLVEILFIPVNFAIGKVLLFLRNWSKKEMNKAMKPEYYRLIEDLDPKEAYFPETISQSLPPKQQGRCRSVLKRFKIYFQFPPSGDTTIVTPRGAIPAWYGKRWQRSLQRLIEGS